MTEKHVATIDIAKALAGVPLTVFAAIGSASGNLLFAGLAALPPAVLIASHSIKDSLQAGKLNIQEEKPLEIPAPFGWKSDIPSWKSLCAEIEQSLPAILQHLEQQLRQAHGLVTSQIIQQAFTDALSDELLSTWLPTDECPQIAAYLALSVLPTMNQALAPVIEQIRKEADSRNLYVIRDVVEDLHRAVVPSKVRDEDMVPLRQQYFDALCQQKMLDFKGISYSDTTRPVSIPLTEVFVLPEVLVGIPEYETLEREDRQKLDKEGKPEKRWEEDQERHRRRELASLKYKRMVVQREDLHPVLAKHRRLVILGDPGAGKSTLLRYLMLTLADKNDSFIKEFPQLTAEASVASPLYISLATYAGAWQDNEVGEKSLIDFLPRYLRDWFLGDYIHVLLEQLQQGTLLLLFDGLDEIPDAALRMQIVRQIEAFTLAYPKNRFVVTSRIVGYKEAPLAADYQVYTLADFNEAQIKAFTTKWCPAYEQWVNLVEESQTLQHAATKEAEKLFLATQRNPGVKRLAVNPLLLTILALIQRQGIALPSHRVELFDLCTTTLLDTWVKTKEPIAAMHFSKSDLIKILRPLAFWMHNHPAVGVIPEEELLEQIVKQLLERKITRYEDEAARLAEQFLQTVRGKTGILVERGKQRYGFLHLTFEEYFAAKELAVQKKTRVEFIKQHLHDARWREVILLSIGSVGILEPDEEGVTELVQEAILHANSNFEFWLYRDVLFAGLCLADDVGVSVTCEEEILQQIVYRFLTSPYDSFRTACAPVLNAWRDTPLGERAVQFILHLLEEQEALMDSMQPVSLSSMLLATKLQEQIHVYCQHMIQQSQESFIRLLRLRLMAILQQARASTMANEWIEYAIAALTDHYGQVHQAAVTALGQVGAGDRRVVDALLNLLSQPEPDRYGQVYQAAVYALMILSVDALTLGRYIEEMLCKYQPIISKQFTADDVANGLLSALQQIVGEV